MRASQPAVADAVRRDAVEIVYEVYGEGATTMVMLPTWSIIHSRCSEMQIPYLARDYRVVTFDPRGNGRSDCRSGPEAHGDREFAADALAVLDAIGSERVVHVGFSMGAQRGLLLAGEHPERVAGAVFIGSAVPPGPAVSREEWVDDCTRRRNAYEDWDKFNRHDWVSDYGDFLEFIFAELYNKAHPTKQREDAVGWGLENDPETLVPTQLGSRVEADELGSLAASVRCPVFVTHGTDDAIRPSESGAAFADLLGGALVLLHGAGHAPPARDPVNVNLLIRQFADRVGR